MGVIVKLEGRLKFLIRYNWILIRYPWILAKKFKFWELSKRHFWTKNQRFSNNFWTVASLCSYFWVGSTDRCDVKISRLCYAQEISPCNTILFSNWTFQSLQTLKLVMKSPRNVKNRTGHENGRKQDVDKTDSANSFESLSRNFSNEALKSSRFSKIKSSNGQFPFSISKSKQSTSTSPSTFNHHRYDWLRQTTTNAQLIRIPRIIENHN